MTTQADSITGAGKVSDAAEILRAREALIQELRAEAKEIVDWHGKTMAYWDVWRKYIADGHKGSMPRDGFESLMGHHADLMERAADAIALAEHSS